MNIATKHFHSSVNFFWNPLNQTLTAFQRNGVLKAIVSHNDDEAVVCILEIPLERIVTYPKYFWTLARENLAGWSFASCEPEFYSGERKRPDGINPYFDWQTTYSVGANVYDRTINRLRSAEFIAFSDGCLDADISEPIPFEIVERIIVPADSVKQLSPDQLDFLQSTQRPIMRLGNITNIIIFQNRDQLLAPEHNFVKSLIYRTKTDPNVLDRFNAALSAVTLFEEQHPNLSPIANLFSTSAVADGHHGTLHTVRVMIWSAFLAQHIDEVTRTAILPGLLAAAAVHDTSRTSNEVEETHGDLAAEEYGDQIRSEIDQGAESCLAAVRLHCRDDAACQNQDLTWQILKDADALDRGRFNPPNIDGGCNTSLLRTDVLRLHDNYFNIAWMAWNLARMTRFTPMGDRPCADVEKAISDSVNAL